MHVRVCMYASRRVFGWALRLEPLQPWAAQYMQPTPSLLGPSAGLLSESTHSIHTLAPMPAHMA